MSVMVEDSLREMFAARVATPPVADDLAARVIRRGRTIRRRRTLASLLGAATALVLVVGGVTALGGWPGGPPPGVANVAGFDIDAVEPELTTPVAMPTPGIDTGIGLDIRSGDQLWTTDGRRLSLDGVGEVTRIYRVPAGWIYAGVDQVRLLRSDGSSLALSGRDGRWVLSADGQRFAFQLGTTLYVAAVSPTGMAVLGNVTVPADSWPVALTADRVLLSVAGRGYGTVNLRTPVRPALNADVTAVYGVRGERVVGLVRGRGGRKNCLAELTATDAGLVPVRSGACDFRPAGTASGAGLASTADGLAPDGRWLAARRDTGVTVLNVRGSLTGPTTTVDCPGEAAVPPVWVDSRTVVTGDARTVIRCAVDGTRQTLPLPEGVGEDWQLVPRLPADVPGQ